MSKREDAFAEVTTEDVRNFWEENPLCAAQIPHKIATREWFAYYDKLREAIESIEYSHALHEYRDFRGKMVLDVGCGNGYVLSKYAAEGARVTGIDVTPTGIDISRKRFEMLGLDGDLRVADAQNMPFEDDSFDCVCSMGVLHHVPDTAKAVREIWRVLKPGGRLIIMMYHRHSVNYQVNYRLVNFITGQPMQEMVNQFDGVGNPKGDVYSKQELRQLLSGFTDLEMRVGFLEPLMFTRRLSYLVPTSIIPLLGKWFGWNLYAKGRKRLPAAAR